VQRAVSATLRELARGAAFREALVWQNRRALHTGVESLLRSDPAATDFKTRQNEALVASYLQRYCAKNDSIGFFGPVGWGSFSTVGPAIALTPGRALVAARAVHFEPWAMDALATRLASDEALRPWLCPRRLPSVRVDGTTLFYPIGKQAEIAPTIALVIALCDGERSAKAIAKRILDYPDCDLDGEAEVLELLQRLVDKRLITWTLELPTGVTDPHATLRALVARVAEPAARARALAPLDELGDRLTAVAAAHGDPAALDGALAALDDSFVRATGRDSTRRAGESYAGRTLAYEDCRRDVALAIGPSLRARLAGPLGLVLASARWYTHAIAGRYRAICDGLIGDSGPLDFLSFMQQLEPHLAIDQHTPPPPVRDAAAGLGARWARLVDLDAGTRRIERTVEELAARAAVELAAPGPGWPGARFHSPDILVAARDVNSVNMGDYQLVLGELHAGWNTFSVPVFLHQHPDPDQLLRAIEIDLPSPRVFPVEPRASATRVYQALVGRHDVELERGETRARGSALRAADLTVERAGGGLQVRARDGRRWELIAFLESWLVLASMAHFRLIPASEHTPRVTLSGLVIARESWRFHARALTFATAEQPGERFVGARRWAREHALPRFVFVRVPEEPKPCYVDFESPIYVESLARLARKGSTIAIVEMLPRPDECWLTDGDDRRFTSELRLAAVDRCTYEGEIA
jgi:hypothetical protein